METTVAVPGRGLTKSFGDRLQARELHRPPATEAQLQTSATCSKGDGPKEVSGYFPVLTPDGDHPNPLPQFGGDADLLPSH